MHPQWRCSPHQSAKVSSMCLRAKDRLWTPRWRPSRASAPHRKTSRGSAVDWRSPTSDDQEYDGRPDHPQGAGDPEAADGGIRMRRPEKRGPSRRALSHSTMLRVGEAEQGYPWPSLFGGYGPPSRRLASSMAACPRHRQIVVAGRVLVSGLFRSARDAGCVRSTSSRGTIRTADRPSGCLSHCATLSWRMARTRSSSEDREDADTSCVQKSISNEGTGGMEVCVVLFTPRTHVFACT